MRVMEEKLAFKSFELIVNEGTAAFVSGGSPGAIGVHIVPITLKDGQRLHHTPQGKGLKLDDAPERDLPQAESEAA